MKPDIEPNKKQSFKFSLKELAEILIKHQGLHEGLFDLSLELQIAVGAVGPNPGSILPGAMMGVSQIGLSKTDKKNIHTVDAAEINPLPMKKNTILKKQGKLSKLKKGKP